MPHPHDLAHLREAAIHARRAAEWASRTAEVCAAIAGEIEQYADEIERTGRPPGAFQLVLSIGATTEPWNGVTAELVEVMRHVIAAGQEPA